MRPACLLVLAAASAAVQVVDGPVFWQDVLLVSLPSALGAVVTLLQPRRMHSEHRQCAGRDRAHGPVAQVERAARSGVVPLRCVDSEKVALRIGGCLRRGRVEATHAAARCGDPVRHFAIRPLHFARAAIRCRAFTWP